MSSSDFRSLNLHPSLQKALRDLEFEQPTPIQRDSIPPALKGRDVLACAATGSGKTAAFLLPILQRLLELKGSRKSATRALILTPTRELAAQIVEHFDALAKYTDLRAAAVYGGVGMNPQERAFRTGVDVIVACPGRLLDHFSRPYAGLDDLEVLVLDEVDRMLDMGFLPDVRRVLRHIPEVDQALFFSATLAPEIAELANSLLYDPVTLHIERASRPAKGIEQVFWPVAEHQKRALLLTMIERGEIHDALVFTRTKHRANRVADFLTKRGVDSDRIHGNRSQAQRTRALANFKSGKTQVLVATDIAARGIDVTELSHVVNFDVPHMPEDYIHRIGRTARAGNTGEAFTFVTPQDTQDVRSIENAVGRRIPTRELEDFDYESQRPEDPSMSRPHERNGGRPGRKPRSNRQGSNRQGESGGRGRSSQGAGQRSGRRNEQARDTESRPQRRAGGRPGGERNDSRRTDGRAEGRNPQRADGRGRSEGRRSEGPRAEGRRSEGRRSEGQGARTQGPSKPRRRSGGRDGQSAQGQAGGHHGKGRGHGRAKSQDQGQGQSRPSGQRRRRRRAS